jgi:hypothetical protein
LRRIALLQSVNALSKLFAETFVFDILNWISIGFEGENKSLRFWEPM